MQDIFMVLSLIKSDLQTTLILNLGFYDIHVILAEPHFSVPVSADVFCYRRNEQPE